MGSGGSKSSTQSPAGMGKFERFRDEYETLDQVQEALRNEGLESSNLIVGIDFTGSNQTSGARTFNGRCLHELSKTTQNPYEHALTVIGKTLAPFDDDNLIPCFGFGDETTRNKHVFNFFPDARPCNGLEEALDRYRKLVPGVHLYGPTSFVPIVEMATKIVEESGGQYHVLLIIADGQVTDPAQTMEAIRKASEYALSIVLIGVGDGPWDLMETFDDNIKARKFDNFQFVNFAEIMSKDKLSVEKRDAMFALAALMEIPGQFKATVQLHLLGKSKGSCPECRGLPPPL